MLKISLKFFVWDWVVKDASCYLKNQLNTAFSVIYFKGEVLYYLYPCCVCRLKCSMCQLLPQMLLWSFVGFYVMVCTQCMC